METELRIPPAAKREENVNYSTGTLIFINQSLNKSNVKNSTPSIYISISLYIEEVLECLDIWLIDRLIDKILGACDIIYNQTLIIIYITLVMMHVSIE